MDERDLLDIRRRLTNGTLSITTLTDDTGVLLDMDNQQVLTLNPVALHIVTRLCKQEASLHEIAQSLSKYFDTEEEQAWQDSLEFLVQPPHQVGLGDYTGPPCSLQA